MYIATHMLTYKLTKMEDISTIIIHLGYMYKLFESQMLPNSVQKSNKQSKLR